MTARNFASNPVRPALLLGWLAVCVLAWLAYLPGLSGGFLFDDFVNLDALGRTGPVDDWPTFVRYITSGTADPLGRPVSLLTFLLDARDWPAQAAPFLRTNLLLHILNGNLLFLLLRQLERALEPSDRGPWIALVAAGTWLLHPLFVSTTLYIVQRQSMLAATFVLLGLLGYVAGRRRFDVSDGLKGSWLIASSLVICTVLAALSKANGLLLPLMAGALELTVFGTAAISAVSRGALNRRLAILVVVPAVAVGIYLGRQLLNWDMPLGIREWTTKQRILTEGRVVLDYLHLLIVPRSVSVGLYNENYPISTGWTNPLSTFPSLIALSFLVWAALKYRRRAPAFAAAVLFFFTGHLLESTAVPLEIYFEHRNYLPAALIFWPVARGIIHWKGSTRAKVAVAAVLFFVLSLTSYQRAAIWGNPQQLAQLWASRNPQSSRAQATAATEEIRAGRPDLAKRRLLPFWRKDPNDLQIALNYVNAACSAGRLEAQDARRLEHTLETANIGTILVRQWLEAALATAVQGNCRGLDMSVLESWLAAAQKNPAINTPLAREKSMPPLLALVSLQNSDPDTALQQFDRALAANISPETAAGQAAILASAGYYRHALAHLDAYERIKHLAPPPLGGMQTIHALVLERQGYWPNELAILRAKLVAELAKPSGSADDDDAGGR